MHTRERRPKTNHGTEFLFFVAVFFVQEHLLEDHGITDRRAASAGGVGFNIRRAARDGTGLHTSSNSMADAATPGMIHAAVQLVGGGVG